MSRVVSQRGPSMSSLYQLSPRAVLYSPQVTTILADSQHHRLLAQEYYEHLAEAWADNIESVVDANKPQVLQWLYDRGVLHLGVLVRAATQAAKNSNKLLLEVIVELWTRELAQTTMGSPEDTTTYKQLWKDMFEQAIIMELAAANSPLLIDYFNAATFVDEIESLDSRIEQLTKQIQQLNASDPRVDELTNRAIQLENQKANIYRTYQLVVTGAARGRQVQLIDTIMRSIAASPFDNGSWIHELFGGYILTGQDVPRTLTHLLNWVGITGKRMSTSYPVLEDYLKEAVIGGNMNLVEDILPHSQVSEVYSALMTAIRYDRGDVFEVLIADIQRRGYGSDYLDWPGLKDLARIWRRPHMLALIGKLASEALGNSDE